MFVIVVIFDVKYGRVVCFTQHRVLTGQAPGPAWIICKQERYLAPTGNRTTVPRLWRSQPSSFLFCHVYIYLSHVCLLVQDTKIYFHAKVKRFSRLTLFQTPFRMCVIYCYGPRVSASKCDQHVVVTQQAELYQHCKLCVH
jgi:hypothetical protein